MSFMSKKLRIHQNSSEQQADDTDPDVIDKSKTNYQVPSTKRERLECKLIKIIPDQKLNLSFACCGFLGIYHLGVAQCFSQHGQLFLYDNVQFFAGASAGSLVACILAVDASLIDRAAKICIDLAKKVHEKKLGLLTPKLNLLNFLKVELENLLPEDAYKIASKKLNISITTNRRPRKNLIINDFESNEDLIQCLLASSYVPHITGTKPIVFRGNKYIDGGLTNNLPILNNGLRTITVSPFSGTQDVCPTDGSTSGLHMNFLQQDFRFTYRNFFRGKHALFPPKTNLEKYFEKGKLDASNFLKYMHLYEVNFNPLN